MNSTVWECTKCSRT